MKPNAVGRSRRTVPKSDLHLLKDIQQGTYDTITLPRSAERPENVSVHRETWSVEVQAVEIDSKCSERRRTAWTALLIASDMFGGTNWTKSFDQ